VNKSLAFYSHDFLSVRMLQDADHPMGPFPAFSSLVQLWTFCQSVREGEMSPDIFYDPMEGPLLEAGYLIFRQTFGLTADDCRYPRRLLAFGMRKLHDIRKQDRLLELQDNFEDAQAEELVEETAEADPTPEEVAAKFERVMIRAAADYLRSKAINRLINAEITWKSDKGGRLLMKNGSLGLQETGGSFSWSESGVRTYDRLSVLLSEISKAKQQGIKFQIHASPPIDLASQLNDDLKVQINSSTVNSK
jgi:hypothetical protein